MQLSVRRLQAEDTVEANTMAHSCGNGSSSLEQTPGIWRRIEGNHGCCLAYIQPILFEEKAKTNSSVGTAVEQGGEVVGVIPYAMQCVSST